MNSICSHLIDLSPFPSLSLTAYDITCMYRIVFPSPLPHILLSISSHDLPDLCSLFLGIIDWSPVCSFQLREITTLFFRLCFRPVYFHFSLSDVNTRINIFHQFSIDSYSTIRCCVLCVPYNYRIDTAKQYLKREKVIDKCVSTVVNRFGIYSTGRSSVP